MAARSSAARSSPAADGGSPRRESVLVRPEVFRAQLEREAARHRRHLEGFGLLRLGSAGPGDPPESLRQAMEVETRATDSVCLLPDGSFVVLAVGCDLPELQVLATRLRTEAADLHRGSAPALRLAVGYAEAAMRRVHSDDLWRQLALSFREACAGGDGAAV